MADALQVSLRLAATICLENAQIVQELKATADLWPDDTVPHARACCLKSEAVFEATVWMYLKTL